MTSRRKYTITERQAEIILRALRNESIDDRLEYPQEYSYGRCHGDILRKITKATKEK